MAYLCGPSVITGVFIRGRQGAQREGNDRSREI